MHGGEVQQGRLQVPSLGEQDLHLWRASLLLPEDALGTLQSWLTPEEQSRGARYATSLLRKRFVAARGQLRWMLGRYLGCPPESIHLLTLPGGKPVLQDHPHLHFNVSHSADELLIGVARSPIGVDIEHINRHFNPREVLQFFSAAEQKHILTGPLEHFYWCWTRKEACLKASGQGITVSLQDMDTLQATLQGWMLRTFITGEVVYSVAVQQALQVSLFQLTSDLRFSPFK
ncbi:4'-phosphopantetheinyl transferase family protein [Deinococcus cellulosilyticus]|uniref:Uncharacterized protein n=1 Tax=Deinococcus cellulosilyticus (strain DSM 18568 / NBRC 106333 / KACC 11606 / 5516J-15) TaxID=1223518 RepID=A0A511N201_DEIC1|nr:4'-phosphopantetheinyl transferase superfamily protein [Deinococcus cellulosilyticus]GEM46874.1 hypothetical protein DC3_25090 [Deinococcus cellulosilyticus NBRC 106333 = KACC 11606]